MRFNACLTKFWHCRWAKCSTEPFTKQQCECAVPLAPRTAGRTTRLGSAQYTWKLPPQATKETHQVTTTSWEVSPGNQTTPGLGFGVRCNACLTRLWHCRWAKCSNTEPFTKQQCECAVPLAPRTPGEPRDWAVPNTLGSSHLRPQRKRTKVTTRLVMGGVAWQPNKRAAKKPSNYGEDPITATLMNEKEGTSLYILLPDRLSEETRAHSVMQSE